jgi:Amt family ammonium transporter
MSDEQLMVGDDSIHGEAAYVFGPEITMSLLHGDISRTAANHDNELGLTIGESPHKEGEVVTTKKNGEGTSGSDEIKHS